MHKMLDIYQLLKQYGTFVYTGDRLGDLQLIEDEVKELYRANALDIKDYQMALLVIRQEAQRIKAESRL